MKQTIESRLSTLEKMFAEGLEKALAAGLKGEPGVSNVPGPAGPQGQQGVPGPTGPPSNVPGPQGQPGEASNVPGPVGATGKTGAVGGAGPVGPSGKNATVRIGTVSVGDVASVKNVGTDSNVILDFVLPRGEKGDQGISIKGDQGIQGESGKNGITFEEMEKFILDIIGNSAIATEAFQQLVKLKKQILVIQGDPRYARTDPHRTEIVKRLKQHYEPTDPYSI